MKGPGFPPGLFFDLSTIFIVDSTIKVVEAGAMTKKPAIPTPAEVEILGILWDRGPSTVREVHERLGPGKAVGYTGVLKLLQNMHAKGLVIRNQDGQAHVYEAREPARMKRQLLGDLMQRVFAGSASQLVLHLLEDGKATPEEIEEIRQMLAEHRRRSK
jgi:predicted transcriptional regulator